MSEVFKSRDLLEDIRGPVAVFRSLQAGPEKWTSGVWPEEGDPILSCWMSAPRGAN